MRRRIDMTEVEAATKIRAKYLRALENEEWDLLPGPTFVKTFLRTYAEFLDLDPRLLVEEYRQRYERPSTQDLTPFGAGRGTAAAQTAPAAADRAVPGRAGRRRRGARRPVSARRGLGLAGGRDAERGHPDADGHRERDRHAGEEVRQEERRRRRRRGSRCGSPPPRASMRASRTRPASRSSAGDFLEPGKSTKTFRSQRFRAEPRQRRRAHDRQRQALHGGGRRARRSATRSGRARSRSG